jgi:glycosyltransferase involved in cell wall biosynthesis
MTTTKPYYESNEIKTWVSIVVASYNTEIQYIYECLESIKNQKGSFGIEIVWINDGSTKENTDMLEGMLNTMNILQNTKIVYKKQDSNRGLAFCLHEGVLLSTNEIIFRMDSDDVMFDTRIQIQLDFMTKSKSCMLCGTNIQPFITMGSETILLEKSDHPFILKWKDYKKTKKGWILNHPTLCFRKTAILKIGNYDKNFAYPFEDLDLELRVLKHFGIVCNLPDILLWYRIHDDQITHKNRNNLINNGIKESYINNITKDDYDIITDI